MDAQACGNRTFTKTKHHRKLITVIYGSPIGKPMKKWKTVRTETSQQHQEKKSTETPLVVANESGLGYKRTFFLIKTVWNTVPKKVKALYTKREVPALLCSEQNTNGVQILTEKVFFSDREVPPSKSKYNHKTDSELVP